MSACLLVLLPLHFFNVAAILLLCCRVTVDVALVVAVVAAGVDMLLLSCAG